MPKDKGVNLFPGELFRPARCSYPGIATLFDRNLIGTANIPDGPSKEIFESPPRAYVSIFSRLQFLISLPEGLRSAGMFL